MTKAMRMMEDNIKLVDGVIFVLDARAPFSCMNKTLEKKLGNKPFLYVSVTYLFDDNVDTRALTPLIRLSISACTVDLAEAAMTIYIKPLIDCGWTVFELP